MIYKTILANSSASLDSLVNEDIKKGWTPQGGVSMIQSFAQSTLLFCQAMIKHEGGAKVIDIKNPYPFLKNNVPAPSMN